MEKIKIAICGYGNLGKGVESEIDKNADMELVAIFSRRKKLEIKANVPLLEMKEEVYENWKDKIDVVVMCGGSATDLPYQVPEMSRFFNTVDSFDTHNNIPVYMEEINKVMGERKNTSVVSVGWDPGLFSINRLFMQSIFPQANIYTFWGDGVSQGHSDAIRRIEGVKNAKQYTRPYLEAIESVRKGENPLLSTRQKHYRDCFVVTDEGADKESIREQIVTMPNYFADYNTQVFFISEEEFNAKHLGIPHGGFVICAGQTGEMNKQVIEYNLKLDSNPEFTASVMIAYARACYKLNKNNIFGVQTIFDIPPVLLTNMSREEQIKKLL